MRYSKGKELRICAIRNGRINSSGEYRFSKYEKYDADNTAANISNYLVPLVRMSEVYYIAAEAIYKKNLDEAKGYLAGGETISICFL